MAKSNDNEDRKQEAEAGQSGGRALSARADRKSGAGSGGGSPIVAPAGGGLRLPPDLRTAEEKAEDDRAAEEHWDQQIAEAAGIKDRTNEDGADYWREVAKKRRGERWRVRRVLVARWLRIVFDGALGRRRGSR